MPLSDDQTPPPLHPFRESAGFVSAVLTALGRVFWPGRRRTPASPPTASAAEPHHLRVSEKIAHLAPFPVDD